MNRRNFIKMGAVASSALAAAGVLSSSKTQAVSYAENPHKPTGAAVRFPHKDMMYVRVFWDKEYRESRAALEQRPIDIAEEMDGAALNYAGWWIHNMGAYGNANGLGTAGGPDMDPLMRWDYPVVNMTSKLAESYSRARIMPRGNPLIWDDQPASDCYKASPEVLTQKVKNAAYFLGASDVGVAKLNPLWVYDGTYNVKTGGVDEWQKDPAQFKYAVCVAIEMQPEPYRHLRSYYASAATGLAYSKMIEISSSLAGFIRMLGYPAIPTGNDTVTQTPVGIDAGLGEAGRYGMLINPKVGSRVRLATVLTDMPLIPDKPISFGVEKFCDSCGKCAEACPSKAVPFGAQSDVVRGSYNRNGFKRWMVDAEKCFNFWHVNRSACNICVSTCPYNKLRDVWFHRVAPRLSESLDSDTFNNMMVNIDDFLGFGKSKPFKF